MNDVVETDKVSSGKKRHQDVKGGSKVGVGRVSRLYLGGYNKDDNCG